MTGALAGHIAQSRAQGWERVGTEVDVDVKVGTARIIGRVDRVERDALGRVRIVDLKTGSSKPSVAEVERHPQLGAYQVAVDAGGFGPGVASAGAALLQLGKAAKSTTDLQVQRALRDDPDPRWATDLIARDAGRWRGVLPRDALPIDVWNLPGALELSRPSGRSVTVMTLLTPTLSAVDCARVLGQQHVPTAEQVAVIEAPLGASPRGGRRGLRQDGRRWRPVSSGWSPTGSSSPRRFSD